MQHSYLMEVNSVCGRGGGGRGGLHHTLITSKRAKRASVCVSVGYLRTSFMSTGSFSTAKKKAQIAPKSWHTCKRIVYMHHTNLWFTTGGYVQS